MRAHKIWHWVGSPGGGLGWIVFAAALAVFIWASRNLVRPEFATAKERVYLLGGDEPWYLMTARSLAFDGDFNVYNDFREHGLLDFADRDHTTLGYKRFQALARGAAAQDAYWQERRYLAVRIGLPLLLAPAYRLGHAWHGQIRLVCVWVLCVLGAAFVRQLFLAGWELTGATYTAAGCALATGFSAPTIFYVTQIYTELTAAFLLLFAFRMIFSAPGRPVVRALFAGLALACAPWLHDKYYLLVILLAVALVCEPAFRRRAALLAFGLPLAVSLALQGAYYHSLYGALYPVSDHGRLTVTQGLQGGFLGLWFDRTDGLIPYWPVSLVALGGLLCLGRARGRAAFWLALLVAAHWVSVGMFPFWTGGPVAPLRYWQPAVAFLSLGALAFLATARRCWVKTLISLLFAIGVAIGFYNIQAPRRLFKDSPPWPAISTAGTQGWNRLNGLWPNLKHPQPEDTRQGLLWVALVAAATLAVGRSGRPARAPGAGT
jgi:hypothetical protein